jgi:hypothetical protein
VITADHTSVFPRLLDLAYPDIVRGEGVWLYTSDGDEVLDACSGGAMVTCLGHGDRDIVEAAHVQSQRISYLYNHHFSNEPQELLAEPARGRGAGDVPDQVRLRRLGGQRDGAPSRPPVPRRPWRHGTVADHLAGAVLPRRADGRPRTHRTRQPEVTVR